MDESVKSLCVDCNVKDVCQTPCKAVSALLWANNRVMERHYGNTIVCYSQNKEVHFCELKDFQIDQFSTDDVVPWSSGDLRLTKTKVFVERFFNKVPCKDLAEQFGVKENTIVCMYKQAVEQLEKLITVLDARKAGIKAMGPEKFTEDQKFFLLACVFGFSQVEVARMFKRDRNVINLKVKRLTDKYETFFSGQEVKEPVPIKDPSMEGKLTRAQVVKMVEAYTEQGLSHRQAFKRIAERYADIVRRPVSYRGIESRYYKTLAACGA